jgi:hypothetical protein
VINLKVQMHMTIGPEVLYLRGTIFSIVPSLFQLYFIVCFMSPTGYEDDFKYKTTL